MLYFLILLDIFLRKYIFKINLKLYSFSLQCVLNVWGLQKCEGSSLFHPHTVKSCKETLPPAPFVVLTECLQIQGLLFMKSQHSHRMQLHVKGAYVAFILSLFCFLPSCSWWATALAPLIHTWKLKSKVVGDPVCSALRGICQHHLLLILVATVGENALRCSHCVLYGVSIKKMKSPCKDITFMEHFH